MANWDVFHGDRLELERSLETARVIDMLGRGELTGDDLIRPAGTSTPWTRIADHPALLEAASPAPTPRPEPPTTTPRSPDPDPDAEPEPKSLPRPGPGPPLELANAPNLAEQGFPVNFDDLGDDDEVRFPSESEIEARPARESFDLANAPRQPEPIDVPLGEFDLDLRDTSASGRAELSSVEITAFEEPVQDEDFEEYDPLDEDEAVAEFTLSRGRPETVEELDLAAMVDVAFQLVLFFLVTATTILYKTLEVPKPNPDANPPASAAQGRSRTLDDLKEDFILVEVDPNGAIQVDREPVDPDRDALVARLREARERTNRQGMLLSADFTTPHRNAVLVYDAANEARLNIAIARPTRTETP